MSASAPPPRNYPRNRVSSPRAQALLDRRVIALVKSAHSVGKIAEKLKLGSAHTYRLLVRVGCRSFILTPAEQDALKRGRVLSAANRRAPKNS